MHNSNFKRKSFLWIISHSFLIATTLICLLTGMRIATQSHHSLLFLDVVLPQGNVIYIHILSAVPLVVFLIIMLGYYLYHYLANHQKITKTSIASFKYHRTLQFFSYFIIAFISLSGIFLFFDISYIVADIHFYLALVMMLYVVLHALVYWVQYGGAVLIKIFYPTSFYLPLTIKIVITFVFFTLGLVLYISNNHHQLTVLTLPSHTIINIDGLADEPIWSKASNLSIQTFGGVNFKSGQTKIDIKALKNKTDIFFYFRWKDDSQSLDHLPIVKTDRGWMIKQSGFYKFDEQTYYEDKFAVMLSDNCQFAAAATAHLGSKPLNDKPKNRNRKGYHYSEQKTVDLWHWKAVRTNDMYLMDDYFIGQPLASNSAIKRYSAGYHSDNHDSGAYVMNWQWMLTDSPITPKRLPIDKNRKHTTSNVMPWFDAKPYTQDDDNYRIGDSIPSVMYTSNRIEGDRGDVLARGIWFDGYWHLEVSRKLNTYSHLDQAISNNTCIWVAAFDHSQVAHTRHVRAIKLNMGLNQ